MISSENEIQMYVHCKLCVEEGDMTSRGLAVGWTAAGLQVWCEIHDSNVMHIDFEGCQHPANQGRKP